MGKNGTSSSILTVAFIACLFLFALPGDAAAESTATTIPILGFIGRVGSYLGYWAAASLTASVALAVCIRDR